jgi:hypothetical protein
MDTSIPILFPIYSLIQHHGDGSGGTLLCTDATTLAIEKVCDEITLFVQVIGHVRTEDIA